MLLFGEDEHFVSDSIKYAKAISSAAQQALNTPENVLGTTTISVSAGNTALAQSDQLLAVATKKSVFNRLCIRAGANLSYLFKKLYRTV